jgi:hypothetical protein
LASPDNGIPSLLLLLDALPCEMTTPKKIPFELTKACREMSRRDGPIVAWHEVPGTAPPQRSRPVGYGLIPAALLSRSSRTRSITSSSTGTRDQESIALGFGFIAWGPEAFDALSLAHAWGRQQTGHPSVSQGKPWAMLSRPFQPSPFFGAIRHPKSPLTYSKRYTQHLTN